MAFDSAKKIGTPKTPSKAKKEKEVVEMANIEQLAQLVALNKAVTGAIKAIEGTLKEDAFEIFLSSVCATGLKPDSVDAVEGDARCNVQFKKRSTTSPFSVEELRNFAKSLKVNTDHIDAGAEDEAHAIVAALQKAKYPITSNVKTQKLFVINPEHAEDEKLMKKVEDVLKRNGLDHIIGVQEEVKTYVADDELMRIACSKKNRDLVRPLAVIAFKPTLDEVDPKKLIKTASEVLDISISVEGDEKKVEEKVREVAVTRSKAKRKTAALEKA